MLKIPVKSDRRNQLERSNGTLYNHDALSTFDEVISTMILRFSLKILPAIFGLSTLVLGFGAHVAWGEYKSMKAHPTDIAERSDFNDYEIIVKDGVKLKGWYKQSYNGKLIILLHGFWGNRSELIDEALFFASQGFGVVVPDIRAHGKSGGNFIGYGAWEVNDLKQILDYFSVQPGVDPQSFGIFGYSMGGALAALVAADDNRIKAVVLSNSPTSAFDLAYDESNWFPWLQAHVRCKTLWFLGINAYDLDFTQAVARIAPRPVLLINGERDQVVPKHRAESLIKAAKEPREVISYRDLGHEDTRKATNPPYKVAILSFFGRHLQH